VLIVPFGKRYFSAVIKDKLVVRVGKVSLQGSLRRCADFAGPDHITGINHGRNLAEIDIWKAKEGWSFLQLATVIQDLVAKAIQIDPIGIKRIAAAVCVVMIPLVVSFLQFGGVVGLMFSWHGRSSLH